MVSATMAIIPRLLRIARVNHGEVKYFSIFCIENQLCQMNIFL
jgi:hypothetical protein